jgi:pimeloyl-ACP methyl ester carboxylesterase
MKPQSHIVEANGLRLHYLEWSRPDVTSVSALVMLHGLIGQAGSWHGLAGRLAKDFRVIALDQRGHGDSQQPETGYAPEDFVTDAATFCRQLGLDHPIIIGHSMGGRIGFLLAANHPELVRALVIIDIGPEASESNIVETVKVIQSLPESFVSPEEYMAFMQRWIPALSEEYREGFLHALRRRPDGRWGWKFRLSAMIEAVTLARRREFWSELASITCPTLLIRGETSTEISPEVAERMARTIPHCRFVEVPGTGHFVHFEKLDTVEPVIRAFLREEVFRDGHTRKTDFV